MQSVRKCDTGGGRKMLSGNKDDNKETSLYVSVAYKCDPKSNGVPNYPIAVTSHDTSIPRYIYAIFDQLMHN